MPNIYYEIGTQTLYYDPETDRYARKTKSNAQRYCSEFAFNWVRLSQLPPRFVPKINMLWLAPERTRIPGLGSIFPSRIHPKFKRVNLYNETWHKRSVPTDAQTDSE